MLGRHTAPSEMQRVSVQRQKQDPQNKLASKTKHAGELWVWLWSLPWWIKWRSNRRWFSTSILWASARMHKYAHAHVQKHLRTCPWKRKGEKWHHALRPSLPLWGFTSCAAREVHTSRASQGVHGPQSTPQPLLLGGGRTSGLSALSVPMCC